MASHDRTVLILATDGLTRRLSAESLAVHGYEVVAVGSGEEAVEVLRSVRRRIGVLVTDVEVSGEHDGLAVARIAREIDGKVGVIFTARSPERVPERGRVSGAPILRTPYHAQQVAGLIGELRQRSPSDLPRAA